MAESQESQERPEPSPAVRASEAVYRTVREKFGDAVSDFDANDTMPFFEVTDARRWKEVALFLRDDSRLDFNYLACLSGMDYPAEGKLGVVCNLESLGKHNHRIAVKINCSRDSAVLPSVARVWKTAEWHEREAFDMYGIRFDAHPDLRRILCPEDWEGYPLRKDYEVQESYHGVKVPY
ncbi:NADH-quinone oxidoreductase subunit C [Prosthecochloris sp. N3]|uniref:NADH-quinone oxidoreductase subunit C n=1 Tax=Prosthecochloris ethylica TaxID=2743976 RepID=A0ABR9XSN6_9CHLB|nr:MULTISPECIES: NADH-quinone oxidoreductase subunit C [Prosthecochloris]MEC9487579.1 NADH-quinone oxidoreductase subunit C [Prosthecochloris sp.]MBF0586651.1 NADH-quinone oxidoreductase subunit C [Prosthecochloris ethylica]MBF0636995.1 NADH-quinone oxidoreductase subunit C [Prosthecochloris ethylica]NUK47866.1 NADH-quinone oxidoreductase subunit C [Prosthecochloris ethylica]RNA65099.1 NADH-quinone oxidoreductase subunit C [Prosthecochloris sp. ZM_2]